MDFKDQWMVFMKAFPAISLPDYSISICTEMKPADKDAEMKCFSDGKPTLWLLQLLLKLVNVPNASVMIIESVERFGCRSTPVAAGRGSWC
jgi:RecG-like helicase